MTSHAPMCIIYFNTVSFQFRLALSKAQQYESRVMNDSSRVNPAPTSSMNVGHSFGCLGHAVLPPRISCLVVWYLMTIKTMIANMIVEKRTVIVLVIILTMRR